jgi:excisionase family DNA binding protein
MADRVETPKQLAERVGLKERAIRRLINAGELDSVRIGARDFIPVDAWGVFIGRKRREKKACQDETKAQSCDGLQIAEPIMSPGRNTVAAASAALARQTAKQLKSTSPTGSKAEASEPAHVIRAKFS